MSKKGIAFAGNMIVDLLYPVENTPKPGELAPILNNISSSSGGAPCNSGMDLAKLDSEIPVTIFGRVGDDDNGQLILNNMSKLPNIDVSRVIKKGTTSFTVVIADQATKQRTFYQYSGANGEFCEDDINLDGLDIDIFHIGYILLLEELDKPDDEYGTKMARLLHNIKQKGIKTSIDVVSENGDRFKRIVTPALKYTDYCIINELEAQATTGIMLRDENDKLIKENIPKALKALRQCGVSEWICIHSVEGGFGLDENDNYVEVPSLKLPDGYIKGSVGAGDAFCSGVLYGALTGWELKKAIELGTASAACSLSDESATGGVRNAQETMAVFEKYSR